MPVRFRPRAPYKSMSYIDPPYPARLDCAIKLPIDYQGGLMFTRDKQYLRASAFRNQIIKLINIHAGATK